LDERPNAATAIPSNRSQTGSNIWNADALRSGLEDAASTRPATPPESCYETDDFFLGRSGVDGDVSIEPTGRGDIYNGEEELRGRCSTSVLAHISRSSQIGLPPLSRATTQSESRDIPTQPSKQISLALPLHRRSSLVLAHKENDGSGRVSPSPGRSRALNHEAASHGHSSPLSPLPADWYEEQSIFVGNYEGDNDGDDNSDNDNDEEEEEEEGEEEEEEQEEEEEGTVEYKESDSTRRKHNRVYTIHDGKRVYTTDVNNSKYSTAAAWVQAHMLEEPVCSSCSRSDGLVEQGEDELSLQEMAARIQDLGVPDTLAGSSPVTEGSQPWEEALSGGANPPRLNMSKSHQLDPKLAIRYDVDAVIAEASSLEALRGFRFSYYPRPNRNLGKPIHIWFHGRRLHLCRHLRFGEAIHAQDIEIYIGFPHMPVVKETFLTEEQHALWIDGVVLPSLRKILPPTSMQHFPATWAIGASKMRARHNEHRTWDVGGTNAIHYPVKEAFVPGLWEAMLERLSDPRLGIFRGMFIVIQTYGTKLAWNDVCFSGLRASVFSDLDKSINRAYLIREKTYFDIAKETASRSARIHWWKTCCLQNWLASTDPKSHIAQRTYPVSGTRDAAAMNIAPTQKHFFHPHVVYAQRYNSYKELSDAQKTFPFTNLNIESVLMPVNLLQLWSKAGGTHGRAKHIEELVSEAGKRSYARSKQRLHLAFSESQEESLGTREEYRVRVDVFETLDLDFRPCRQAEPRPYYSIPTAEAILFLRWQMNRWLGALDYLLRTRSRLTPASGAMGTLLARVIKAVSNDSAYGHAKDLYCDSYSPKEGCKWIGLGFRQIMQETGMFWLKHSMFDWERLQFQVLIEGQIRFFIPDSQRTYRERRQQVNNATKLFHGISDIARSFKVDGSTDDDHKLNRIRRICFLALTMEVLRYGRNNQPLQPPKDLASYNYGICKDWLGKYYSGDFHIPRDWRVCMTWRERPTWAALIQQLFDWDDQHLYKIPFTRKRWDNLPYRLVTRHAFDEISQSLGIGAAKEWKSSLGIYGCEFFWMLPKCTSDRFGSMSKKTEGAGPVKIRKSHLSWYAASHEQLATCQKNEGLREWDWTNQALWDWQGGVVTEHVPLCLFDNLEEFEFNPTRSYSTALCQLEFRSSLKENDMIFEVEEIIAKRELKPRVIEYQVKWVGYPHKKDYTWEPVWQLKADVPKLVKAYETAERAKLRNLQN